jgi:hypothetical protein
MTGDSYFLRGSAENVTTFLREKFNVYSVVKPGSDINTLMQSVKKDMNALTNKHVAPMILINKTSKQLSILLQSLSI